LGAAVQDTCCTDPLCALGRGHLPGSSGRCIRDGLDRAVPDARPRPLSRQSTRLSAIHWFSGSAGPSLTPFLQTHKGRSDLKEPDTGQMLLPGGGIGVSPACPPMAAAPGNASPMPRRSAGHRREGTWGVLVAQARSTGGDLLPCGPSFCGGDYWLTAVDARPRESTRSARWVPGGTPGVGQTGNRTAKMVSSLRIVIAASVWCTTRIPNSRAGSR